MWCLTYCQISVSLLFLNWIKNDFFLSYLSIIVCNINTMTRYILVQKRETNWNFTGCQAPHFMIIYQFIKPFLDTNEYPQSMFWAEIRKIMYTPVNPTFTT